MSALKTFTKTTENASLPPSLSVMSGEQYIPLQQSLYTNQAPLEFADVTEQLLDKHSLAKILNDPAILPYFRSLSVSFSSSQLPQPHDPF